MNVGQLYWVRWMRAILWDRLYSIACECYLNIFPALICFLCKDSLSSVFYARTQLIEICSRLRITVRIDWSRNENFLAPDFLFCCFCFEIGFSMASDCRHGFSYIRENTLRAACSSHSQSRTERFHISCFYPMEKSLAAEIIVLKRVVELNYGVVRWPFCFSWSFTGKLHQTFACMSFRIWNYCLS